MATSNQRPRTIDLSEAEERDLIALIQQGKALLEKYRFVLYEDKRENEWQSFRTRQCRTLELTTPEHSYAQPGRYTVAVKVIDIFSNDTMTLVPVNVG